MTSLTGMVLVDDQPPVTGRPDRLRQLSQATCLGGAAGA
jgi:hypothetical protein